RPVGRRGGQRRAVFLFQRGDVKIRAPWRVPGGKPPGTDRHWTPRPTQTPPLPREGTFPIYSARAVHPSRTCAEGRVRSPRDPTRASTLGARLPTGRVTRAAITHIHTRGRPMIQEAAANI